MTNAKTAAASSEDKTAAEAARHAPVSLPSGGSFDRETLQSGLDKATKAPAEKRDDHVNAAIEDARTDAQHTSSTSPNALPGHKEVVAEVQLAKGSEIGTGRDKKTVGGVVVHERRQVVDPDKQVDAVSAATGGQAVTSERSEILSVEDGEKAGGAGPSGGDESGSAGD